MPASSQARSIRPPVIGNWEGKGPHGLALSFQLTRAGTKIRATALAVTVPVGCPATVRDALAVAGTSTVYAGPRAAPPGLSHPLLSKPGTIGLSLSVQPFPIELEGRLVNPRRAVLAMATPSGRNMACWPRTLRFTARPSSRVPVSDGRWNGTLTSTDGVTGMLHLDVVGHGRTVTTLSFSLACPDGSGSYTFGPDKNGQFVSANSTFSGPAAHSAAPGLLIAWRGQFSSNTLTGSIVNLGDPCGLGGSQSVTFTARHT